MSIHTLATGDDQIDVLRKKYSMLELNRNGNFWAKKGLRRARRGLAVTPYVGSRYCWQNNVAKKRRRSLNRLTKVSQQLGMGYG
jgi:hypothetical protein